MLRATPQHPAPPPPPGYAFDSPAAAVAAVLAHLSPLATEAVRLHAAAGRALAQTITTDRPSPACDVSAMDGYAFRIIDVAAGTLPVTEEVAVGQPPPSLSPGGAARIFTGGPVPAEADCVVPREHVTEHGDRITLDPERRIAPGQHIRRRGENAPAGAALVQPGVAVTPGVAAAASAFGCTTLRVHLRVRLATLVTGNEVHEPGSVVEPWQLRDSNGPALFALFAPLPWIDAQPPRHAPDDPQQLLAAIEHALASSDALLLTGGVSMGDFDFVPEVLRRYGVEVVFHRLPIRPGKPILVGVGPRGQAVVALPGNPVSAMVGARRFAAPLLRKLAGFSDKAPPRIVEVANDDGKTLDLHWFRLARLTPGGAAKLVATRGSGDIASAAQADGFVEVPAHQPTTGPHPFYPWTI